MAEKRNAYVHIELGEDGRINYESNMSELGAVHLLNNISQKIIEDYLNQEEQDIPVAEQEQ